MIAVNTQFINTLAGKVKSQKVTPDYLRSQELESLIPADPNSIKARDGKKQIVILGACSGENSVVARFHSKALEPYRNAGFNFIGVDTSIHHSKDAAGVPKIWLERILPQLKGRGMEFDTYYHPDEFFRLLLQYPQFVKNIAGVIIATPPSVHLGNLKNLVTAFNKHQIKDVPILLEKPVSLIGQEAEIAELTKQYPGNIIGADFAVTSPALNYALGSGLLDRVGDIKAIMGRCIENFDMETFVNSIQERNLCVLEKSGGGIGFDMGPHVAGPIARILNAKKLDLANAEIKHSLMKRVSHENLKNNGFNEEKWDPLAETYWYSHSTLNQGTQTPIEIYTEAAKDANTDDYSIVQINGDKGTLIISAGTQTGHKEKSRNVSTKPFVMFIPKALSETNQAELFTFEPGIGYEGVFDLFMKKASQKIEVPVNVIDQLVDSGIKAVDYIRRTYLKGLNGIKSLESYAFGKVPDPELVHAVPSTKEQPFIASSRDLAKALTDISAKSTSI